MGNNDFVNVTIKLANVVTPTAENLKVPMLAGYHTHWPDRTRTYDAASALSDMVTDGFSLDEPLYKAAAITVSQPSAPSQIVIGRCSNMPSQTLTLTVTDNTPGDALTLTLVGTDGFTHAISYTIPGSSTTTISATAIAAHINALANVATTIGTVTSDLAVITIARTDGNLTDVQYWCAGISLADTTADPGIAADLTAILAANPIGWASFGLASNSPAEVKAAQAWAEATGQGGKELFSHTADEGAVNSGTTTDIFSNEQTESYQYSFAVYNGTQLLSFAGVALMAQLISQNPGQFQAAWAVLDGVPVDVSLTETQAMVLNTWSATEPGPGGKYGNYYRVSSGLNVTFPGTVGTGELIHVIFGINSLQVALQAAVTQRLASGVKLDDFGLGLIGDSIMSILKLYARSDYGFLDPTSLVVSVPKASSLSAQDKADGNPSGITWSAELSLFAMTANIGGTVSP